MKVLIQSVIFLLIIYIDCYDTNTIIVVEDAKACFRRVLAGKRVARDFVRRTLSCESVEDCQGECAEEKHFACEGFNYRLDPTGRGKGECELLDVPVSHLDMRRDLYADPDYDYYEKDRNAAAAAASCKGVRPMYGNRPHYYPPPPPPPPLRPSYYGSGGGYGNRRYYEHGWQRRPAPRPPIDYANNPDYHRPYGTRRGDIAYHSFHHQNNNYNRREHGHYAPPLGYRSYEPFLPPKSHGDREIVKFYAAPDKDVWGFNKHTWGAYGGAYGDFGFGPYSFKNEIGAWGQHGGAGGYGARPPPPPPAPGGLNALSNAILPAEPRPLPPPPTYNFLKDECSLRSATGFRLHKGIVKKFYAVPNIYECELLCYKEKDFPCASYAFRYTVSLTSPTDNCYLSDRNYKELDFYTDLQPDRDFDIYTMNNQNHCTQSMVPSKASSECFWRVRSGQRLDGNVVRDSLTTKTIVECQVECLRSARFTCRAFSFRYGPPPAGGVIDNCQLTDWPYLELDPRTQLVYEPGFELYERGSYGHGCEPDHFSVRGRPADPHVDRLCYVGFGAPARLLPQATRRALSLPTELDCKTECSKARDERVFQCLSFSYTPTAPAAPNCLLSDIMQRDLLPSVDYAAAADSWLFAWDHHNPECVALMDKRLHHNGLGQVDRIDGFDKLGYDVMYPLDTWRVYSVSGWPCRRGSLCQENREAGFWFCELEGGDASTWDYCCRPDHQCGFSEGHPYQWCYVGPERTQWRKCSDRYYPYVTQYIDRLDGPGAPLRPGARPDRPAAPPRPSPARPSLDEYETEFASQFLDPPRPGGFGQPRRWPLSYLHKDAPPAAASEPRLAKDAGPRYAAIQSLIDAIKANDLNNVQFHITNESNASDDTLYVKIPLPTSSNATAKGPPAGALAEAPRNATRSQKSLLINVGLQNTTHSNWTPLSPVYRRSFIVRTNVTNYANQKNTKI